MKKLRKIILSLTTLAFLLVCLSTTTFAWFQVYSTVEVGFNIKVTSGLGFLVSIDNKHFYNDLSTEQIVNAIILSFDKAEDPSNPKYVLRDDEKLYYVNSNIELTLEEKKELIKNMKVKPRTTNDGLHLYDLDGTEFTQEDGSFIRFDVYFETVNRSTEIEELYDIYVLGEDYVEENGNTIKASYISSAEKTVNLIDELTTWTEDLVIDNQIKVYPSNAMRFSIYDETKFEENEVHKADIYELTNSGDLGSYATDYYAHYGNGNRKPKTDLTEEERLLSKLYDSYYNAGFTYYNNLKNSNLSPLKYEDDHNLLDIYEPNKYRPDTIKDITDIENIPTVTSLTTGKEAKKITFTIWLEGWDADCFDGIADNVTVYLAFTSVKRENNENL